MWALVNCPYCSIVSNAPHTLYASRHLLVCKDSRLSNSCYVMKLFFRIFVPSQFFSVGDDSSLARHPHLVCLALPDFPTPHVRSPSPSDRPSMWHVILYSVDQGRTLLACHFLHLNVIFSTLTLSTRLPLVSLYNCTFGLFLIQESSTDMCDLLRAPRAWYTNNLQCNSRLDIAS